MQWKQLHFFFALSINTYITVRKSYYDFKRGKNKQTCIDINIATVTEMSIQAGIVHVVTVCESNEYDFKRRGTYNHTT